VLSALHSARSTGSFRIAVGIEYYLSIKKNEMIPFTEKWMEIIMLNEIN
jgi:hypothetical protein